jgi:hypothetical protein
VDHVVEAAWLATLVSEVSKVLEDLGMSPILEIPRDRARPATSWAVDIILEHVKEAYDSGHGIWE